MAKTYLYQRAIVKKAQLLKLQAEYPEGEPIIDRKPPQALEQLIAEMGPDDLLAAVNIYDLPELTAETYNTICSHGAALHFLQQPYLNSEVFRSQLAGNPTEAATAANILQAQLDITAAQQAQLRKKETIGRIAAAAEGRIGGQKTGTKQERERTNRVKERVSELLKEGLNGQQIYDRLQEDPDMKTSRNSIYKYIRELQAQDE